MNSFISAFLVAAIMPAWAGVAMAETASEHPRLYFTPDELTQLRDARTQGVHARLWNNLAESADWCLTRQPRTDWIAPVEDDPIYENLYDRFYAIMHDVAVMEHLAFAYAYSGDPRYEDGAKRWLLACCRVWSNEADGEPDQNKAYAVMRLLKGAATGYDLLYHQLDVTERDEVRQTIVDIMDKYDRWYRANPEIGTVEGQNHHHASIEVASFGIAALALLGETPQADDWLRLAVDKHTRSLLPGALTDSGTQRQSSNYWASTMQYRIMFLDPLKRITGRDLFTSFAEQMSGRIALAAVVAPLTGRQENQRTVLFAPNYGQINYWSPVLFYLARQYRGPTYQRLALWDGKAGSIHRTNYVTPNGERLLFDFGGLVYAWYDPTVPSEVEPDAPLSFLFASRDPDNTSFDVNEAYLRASYEPGGLAVGALHDMVILHAGGRAVYVDTAGGRAHEVATHEIEDDGDTATLRTDGGDNNQFSQQIITLRRPDRITLTRHTDKPASWWWHDHPAVRKPASFGRTARA